MNIKLVFSLLLSILLLCDLMGQPIPLGTWRSHLSYQNALILEKADTSLFCATDNGLYSYNLENEYFSKITKDRGAGDVSVSSIHYAQQKEWVIVGYESGIVDILTKERKITTLFDLKNSPLLGNRKVSKIVSIDQMAFLVTEMGIVKIDLNKKKFVEIYRNIGKNATQIVPHDICIDKNDTLFIFSDQGIQSASLSSNLLDFNAWRNFEETADRYFSHPVVYRNQMYVLRNHRELWTLQNNKWQSVGVTFPQDIRKLQAHPTNIIAQSQTALFSTFPSPKIIHADGQVKEARDFMYFSDENIWIADSLKGLLHFGANKVESHIPLSPLSDTPSKIKSLDDQIFLLFGGNPDQHQGKESSYNYWKEGVWKEKKLDNFSDISDVEKFNEEWYFSSFSKGLLNQTTGVLYSTKNGTFEKVIDENLSLSSMVTGGGKLWITAYNHENSIYSMDTQNQFSKFKSSQVGTQHPMSMKPTESGILWIIKGEKEGGGMVAFDTKQNRFIHFDFSKGIPSATINQLTINNDNVLWIATDKGIATFNHPDNPFTSTANITLPYYDNTPLFKDEQVNDLFFDGGERLWVATQNGVWVFGSDFSNIAHRFTEDNSPLPSNEVKQLAYLQNTGEVFMLTSKGLVSYQSVATQGGEMSQLKVFPNPVSISYTGVVGIAGAPLQADLKIVDIKGRLVADIPSHGNRAGWDLRNFQGNKIKPGVYLIFSSQANGKEVLVGKIAVTP